MNRLRAMLPWTGNLHGFAYSKATVPGRRSTGLTLYCDGQTGGPTTEPSSLLQSAKLLAIDLRDVMKLALNQAPPPKARDGYLSRRERERDREKGISRRSLTVIEGGNPRGQPARNTFDRQMQPKKRRSNGSQPAKPSVLGSIIPTPCHRGVHDPSPWSWS